MENTTGIINILGKGNNGQFSLAFNCEGYDLFFSGEKGCAYIDVYFFGNTDPFTTINCWDYRQEKSGINDMIDFANYVADFVEENADNLPAYFANN